jgi:acetylornithine deacetylase/succinyl-diaminopimelate desuccinylase-like protein
VYARLAWLRLGCKTELFASKIISEASSKYLIALLCVFTAVDAANAQNKKKEAVALEGPAGILQGTLRFNTSNPPGNEKEAALYLKRLLDAEGIPCEVFESTPGRANVLARLSSAVPSPRPPLLLLHHMDVVGADPSEWTVPPFDGAVKDGSLWGRGALDSKLTGALQVAVLIRLKRENVPLNRDVILLASADEEEGGRWGTGWMVERHWKLLNPAYVIDEGGFGFRGVFSYKDDVVYACAVGEKKVLGLRVSARGRSGHASMPYDDNPHDILRRALTRIEQTFVRLEGRPSALVSEMERRLGSIRPSPLAYAIRHNTVAATSFLTWSGNWEDPTPNVIPGRAVATLDCRLLPGEDETLFLKALEKAVDDPRVTIAVTRRSAINGTRDMDYAGPLFQALEDTVRKHDPGARVTPFLYPGATDSRFFRARGVPCYGIVPVVLTEEEFSRIHSADERVPLDRLEKGFEMMYDWIRSFAAQP